MPPAWAMATELLSFRGWVLVKEIVNPNMVPNMNSGNEGDGCPLGHSGISPHSCSKFKLGGLGWRVLAWSGRFMPQYGALEARKRLALRFEALGENGLGFPRVQPFILSTNTQKLKS